MKKILLFFFCLFPLIFFIIACGENGENGNEPKPDDNERTGLIPDPNLEAAIRKAIDKLQGDITKEDLQEITKFSFDSYKEVAELTGLEHCTNLQSLSIEGLITDISPLSELINLESLGLYLISEIGDISALKGLINLQYLEIRGGNIRDISFLSSLINLEEAWLSSHQITDIPPLSGLKKLHYLYLHLNKITDISPLSNLTSLQDVDLSFNKITDISPLSSLKSLKELYIMYNQINDVSALSELKSLEYLGLEGNEIVDISPLVDNPGIDKGDCISLEGNPLSNESISIYIPILEKRGVKVYF